MGLPPSVHDPQQVRDLADRILAESRYQRPAEPIPERILGWFFDQIDNVLGSLVGSGAGTVAVWLVVVGVIGLTIWLIVRYGRVGRLQRPAEPAARVMVELTRTSAEWLAEADEMEAAARWKDALRCRHRALISELVRRGSIPDRAGRTAREYVGDIAAARADDVPDFTEATDLFEAAWYGDVPVGPEQCARFRVLGDAILGERVRV